MEAAVNVPEGIRVLIADDHRLFGQALEAILATDDRLEVVGHAGDGSEAVQLALAVEPDVILMDIAMPVMDGFQATKQIRKQRPHACVLMLTGSNSADRRRPRAGGRSGRLRDQGSDRRGADRRDPRSRLALTHCYPAVAMVQALAVIQVLLSMALVGLILMHSGRDAGLGGMGFTPASQGGTHIVERNLTRLTVVVGILFVANCILLFHALK